ncbi:Uncharacterised protein [Chryseobacterium nakagawai]|uniref:Uncharacterized protein n=1 Tax=Chryseobacterium nakagawai TaxID=1241982 RepID=A0AAD0YLU3_CHRNA|nr:hypothetical protein [Chryseobacterium nakagawai]AZA91182.1 hypothetical protein EG343_11340 [Chryseobacterium nakagawai]VEH22747.1 Uncharacterised protein [Chryseobacterium nakagawai]
MDQSNFKIGQIVYQVGVNILSQLPEVQEHKVLCVGTKSIYTTGKDVHFHYNSESTFFFSFMDVFNPDELLNAFAHTVWTDDREKAEKYCSKMLEIVQYKNNLKKAG